MNASNSKVIYPPQFHTSERPAPACVNAEAPSVQTLPAHYVRIVRFVPVYFDVEATNCLTAEEACQGSLEAVKAGRVLGVPREMDSSPLCVQSVFRADTPNDHERVPPAFKLARLCADWLMRISCSERSESARS